MPPSNSSAGAAFRQEEGIEVGENVGQIVSGVLGGGLENIFQGSTSFIGDSAAQQEAQFVLHNIAPALDVVLKYGFQGIKQYFGIGVTTTPKSVIATQQELLQKQIQENNQTIQALQQILALQKLQQQHSQQLNPPQNLESVSSQISTAEVNPSRPSTQSQTMDTLKQLQLLQKFQLQNFENLQQTVSKPIKINTGVKSPAESPDDPDLSLDNEEDESLDLHPNVITRSRVDVIIPDEKYL